MRPVLLVPACALLPTPSAGPTGTCPPRGGLGTARSPHCPHAPCGARWNWDLRRRRSPSGGRASTGGRGLGTCHLLHASARVSQPVEAAAASRQLRASLRCFEHVKSMNSAKAFHLLPFDSTAVSHAQTSTLSRLPQQWRRECSGAGPNRRGNICPAAHSRCVCLPPPLQLASPTR